MPQGWAQIEAVVSNLRQHYTHDRLATAAPASIDVVADFLLGSRRGPDYLFASAAVVMIRSLGYPARLVSGLYAVPDRYDPRTRHTPVTSNDVHVWAEVRIPNGHWVAVEPTPDYELLPPTFPWSELIVKVLKRMGYWVQAAWQLPAGWKASCLQACSPGGGGCSNGLGVLTFALFPDREPRGRVLRALRMVERRARWAGHPRPPGLTLIAPVSPRQPRWLGRAKGIVTHADRPGQLGCPCTRPTGVEGAEPHSEIERDCPPGGRTAGRSIASASLLPRPPGTVVSPREQS